jgi:hypothetical protein
MRRGKPDLAVSTRTSFDFFPDQHADQKNDERERHVSTHECGQARTQQIQSECTECHETSNWSVSGPGSAKQEDRQADGSEKRWQTATTAPMIASIQTDQLKPILRAAVWLLRVRAESADKTSGLP